MRRMMRFASLAILLCSSSVTAHAVALQANFDGSSIERMQLLPQVGSISDDVRSAPDITPLLQRLAKLGDFHEWAGASATRVRQLENRSGTAVAILWSVQLDDRASGYVVTSPDGVTLYEWSRGAVPDLPEKLRGKLAGEQYLYAGPTLHLVSFRAADSTAQLYNLFTGETLAGGKLEELVPKLTGTSGNVGDRAVERKVASPSDPELDALFAVGRYGQHKLDLVRGADVFTLREFSRADSFANPAFLVFDPIPDKLYVSLQVMAVISQGDDRYLAVRDPFAKAGATVYIDSRFPLLVIRSASSAT